jgi:cyclase
MLKKRIIPCLDIKDGRTVKGVNFLNLKDAGDPVMLAMKYVHSGADELVFLDISATEEKRKTLIPLITRIAREVNIPFTVGGGIDSPESVRDIIGAGADKISINSAAIKNPGLITQIARQFGSQCVVVAMDIRYENKEWMVYAEGGKKPTGLKVIEWAKEVEELGAGELLLTSMDNDGMKNGFAIDITDTMGRSVNIPVIASGGAGKAEHFKELFQQTNASAALAASIFHYGELTIPQLKLELCKQQIPIRWK